jgi:hypothetical protein
LRLDYDLQATFAGKASIAGDLVVATSVLFADVSTGFVGISARNNIPLNLLDMDTSLDANTDPSDGALYAMRISQSGSGTGKGNGILFSTDGVTSASIIATDRGGENKTAFDFHLKDSDAAGGFRQVMRIDSDGQVGMGTADPRQALHVLVNGTSTYTGVELGVLITDDGDPSLIFEATGEATDKKVMSISYNTDAMRFNSLTDAGGLDVFDILCVHRDGNVGVGTDTPAVALDVVGEINTDGHEVGTIPANTYEIWTIADLPNAPSGGKIILPSGRYLWMQDITITDNFEIEDGASVQWVMPNGYANSMTWSGTGTFISTEAGGSGAFRILDQGITIYLTEDNVTLFDITGTLGYVWSFFGFLGTGGSMGQMIGSSTGTLTSRRFFSLNSSVSGWTTGLTLTGSNRISADTGTITSHANASGGFFIQDAAQAFANYTRLVFNRNNANASDFDIRPSNENDTAMSRIDSSSTLGSFFATDITGSFTSITDDTSIGDTVVSVAAGAVASTRFNKQSAHGYKVGDWIENTSFTVGAYNGFFKVVFLPNTQAYEVEVPFTVTDTGDTALSKVILADVAHGLSTNDQINITGTLDYDAGYRVLSVPTADTFAISAVFVTDETGDWNRGSLDETSKYVNAESNGSQRNSQPLASTFVSGNAVATSITGTGTYDPLNLGTASTGSANENFTLIDAATGEMRCDTLNSFEGKLTATLSVLKTGGAVDYRFRAYKTVGSGAFDVVTVSRGISTITSAITLVTSVIVDPGDQFRIEAETLGATNDITISDFSMVVE